MEVEFLEDSASTLQKKSKTFAEIMEEQFPIYLDAGMSPADYWDGDVTYVKAYREVLERRREWQNQMLWMQGLYFYNALTAVMPALSIKSKSTNIEPYLEKPFPITNRSVREDKEQKEKEQFEKNISYMKSFAAFANKKFSKKSEVKI